MFVEQSALRNNGGRVRHGVFFRRAALMGREIFFPQMVGLPAIVVEVYLLMLHVLFLLLPGAVVELDQPFVWRSVERLGC